MDLLHTKRTVGYKTLIEIFGRTIVMDATMTVKCRLRCKSQHVELLNR